MLNFINQILISSWVPHQVCWRLQRCCQPSAVSVLLWDSWFDLLSPCLVGILPVHLQFPFRSSLGSFPVWSEEGSCLHGRQQQLFFSSQGPTRAVHSHTEGLVWSSMWLHSFDMTKGAQSSILDSVDDVPFDIQLFLNVSDIISSTDCGCLRCQSQNIQLSTCFSSQGPTNIYQAKFQLVQF